MTTAEARTLILDKFAATPSLAVLDLTNPLSTERLLIEAIAEAQATVTSALDAMKFDIEQTAIRASVGTPAWVANIMRDLRWNASANALYAYQVDLVPGYFEWLEGADDPLANIITVSTYKESAALVTISVAKGTGSSKAPLSLAELAAARQYANDRARYAGPKISIQSREPDKIKVVATMPYYPAVKSESQAIADATAAINDYINNHIGADGVINKNKMIDYIQNVRGVKDFWLTTFQRKDADASTYENIGNEAQLTAGYAVLESPTITAIPKSFN